MKCRQAVESDADAILRVWKDVGATESVTDDVASAAGYSHDERIARYVRTL